MIANGLRLVASEVDRPKLTEDDLENIKMVWEEKRE